MRPVPSKQDCNSDENFCRAILLFLQRTLNKKKARDRQYIYLQPGGDHIFQKAMMTKSIDHLRRFKEMLCSAKALPAGDMPAPNDALKVEPGTSRADDASATKHSRPSPSISTTSTTHRWPMACSQSSLRSRLSFAQNTNSTTR